MGLHVQQLPARHKVGASLGRPCPLPLARAVLVTTRSRRYLTARTEASNTAGSPGWGGHGDGRDGADKLELEGILQASRGATGRRPPAWKIALATATCAGALASRRAHAAPPPPPPPPAYAAVSVTAARPRHGADVGGAAGLAAATAAALAAGRAKFLAAWVSYATIPIIAGLLNWATNTLAVQMIFAPMEYRGFGQRPGEPLGYGGWQGIVPAKAEKMASTMVDLMTSRLLNISQVFGRLDSQTICGLLAPAVGAVAVQAAGELTAPGSGRELAPRIYSALPSSGKEFAANVVRAHGDAIITNTLKEMQGRIREMWDVKGQVVGAMVENKQIIVDLFKRCGRDEFIFIRRSGLYFGFLFGIVQMLVWVFWDPWWSLALGGALVGYVTNWLALTLMFSPIEPVKVGPFTLHGAFLRRQQEVSGEFASLLRSEVLTAENIWKEILEGPMHDTFDECLARQTRLEMGRVAAGTLYGKGAKAVLGADGWAEAEALVVAGVAREFPRYLPRAYPYSDEALDLEATLRTKMRELSSEEFEGVLHPVFQEDELTLIVVGGVLGALAGLLQAIFVFG